MRGHIAERSGDTFRRATLQFYIFRSLRKIVDSRKVFRVNGLRTSACVAWQMLAVIIYENAFENLVCYRPRHLWHRVDPSHADYRRTNLRTEHWPCGGYIHRVQCRVRQFAPACLTAEQSRYNF